MLQISYILPIIYTNPYTVDRWLYYVYKSDSRLDCFRSMFYHTLVRVQICCEINKLTRCSPGLTRRHSFLRIDGYFETILQEKIFIHGHNGLCKTLFRGETSSQT